MTGVYITTSQRSLMRPLACQGILVTDCFHQLDALLQGLSAEHRALLAEPVHSASQVGHESVDWYASPTCPAGIVRTFESLSPEEKEKVSRKIQTLVRDISAKSDALMQSADTQQQLSGQMLTLAMQYPSEEDIWVMGEQPILVNWGFAPGTVGAQPEDLTRKAAGFAPAAAVGAAAPLAATPVAASPRVFSGCLAWLLPLLLLLLLLLLILSALHLLPFTVPFPTSCMPTRDGVALAEAKKVEQGFLTSITDIEKRLYEHTLLCVPKTPDVQIVPKRKLVLPVEEPLVQEVPKRKLATPLPPAQEPFFGQKEEPPKEEKKPVPKVEPKPKPEPKPEPKPVPRQKPKKNSPLEIPKDAKKNNDMSFLEGCWVSDRGLVNSRTRRPIIVEYCFNKTGQGRRIIRESGGKICTGNVNASFGGGSNLVITAPEAMCPRGTSYVGQRVNCTGSDRSTDCRGQESGSRNRWDAKFRRK